MSKDLKYFKDSEFKCPCCGANDMCPSFKAKLDLAREKAEVPFKITSGYRCEAHNKEVGGSKTSSHLNGFAVDIAVGDSATRFAVIGGLVEAGFNRIGIGKTFIHVDMDSEKSPYVCWLY